MKILSFLPNLIGDAKIEMQTYNPKLVAPLYGPPNTFLGVPIRIAISVVCIGVVVGIIVLVKRKMKKNDINNAQALYGPPENFKKKSKVDPPEDLYGCPRPDGMD